MALHQRVLIGTLLCILHSAAVGVGNAQQAVSVDDIDPMIGTITLRSPDDFYGLGKTFPGAATPLGMVQLSPDTITGGTMPRDTTFCTISLRALASVI